MTIIVRSAPYGAIQQPDRWWLGGDPSATAFYTALSAAFPPGERFFIETLIGVVDQLPAPLAAAVREFARQEANHARQHLLFNRAISSAGHATAELEAQFARGFAVASNYSPLARVAFTAALEHLTTILARELLRNPRAFAGAARDIERFWKWHAVEEIEHKAVAFDVYSTLATNMTPHRRWRFRIGTFRAATRVIVFNIWRSSTRLTQERFGATGTRARLLWFLLVYPGIYRRCFAAWLSFFIPGYHPAKISDDHLLASVDLA